MKKVFMLKINLSLLTLLFAAFLFSSCQKSENVKPEQAYLDDAKKLYDEKKFDESIAAYRELIKNYPASEKNAIYAYNQIAGIYFDGLKDYQKTVDTYRELAEKYPNSKEAKQSLFMVAFTYDEYMKDKDKAKDAYKKFLEKYPNDTDPNDKMSESARTMLQVLESGKTIEDMIKENSGNTDKTSKTTTIDTTKSKK
ncbi:MAG: tetratricopeptide repeat protein [Ignavibacteria bacterium]|nr:tetratricopeptide repeat protein [Ignavibacteria bacterium]